MQSLDRLSTPSQSWRFPAAPILTQLNLLARPFYLSPIFIVFNQLPPSCWSIVFRSLRSPFLWSAWPCRSTFAFLHLFRASILGLRAFSSQSFFTIQPTLALCVWQLKAILLPPVSYWLQCLTTVFITHSSWFISEPSLSRLKCGVSQPFNVHVLTILYSFAGIPSEVSFGGRPDEHCASQAIH